jgi:hypothetical protein
MRNSKSSPFFISPNMSPANNSRDSTPQIKEIKPMSRQTSSIFTASTQASGLASVPVTPIESMGVTRDFSTLEIRATLKVGAQKKTLFTFHGGSVMKSEKGNMFTAFMLRPFIYAKDSKELVVNKETGELQHSSVKSFLVKATETQVPEALKPIVDMLKVCPPEQRQVALEVAKLQLGQLGISADTLTQYIYGTDTLEHTEISASKFLSNLFKHENVRFKANISSKFESKIENIVDKISGGEDKYSIVLRFDLTKVNAVKELVELQYYADGGNLSARTHPVTGDTILLQEVSIPLTYIGIEKGTTYDEDTSKYLNPMLSIQAALTATKDSDKPVYMDYSVIEGRAEKVNAWKAKLDNNTGKKFLKNSGILERLYDELPKLVMSYVPGASEEVDSIFKSLEEDERISPEKLNQMKVTYLDKVKEAEAANAIQSTQPEQKEKDAAQVEEVSSVTEDAVNLLNSSAFSLDSLLGMNLAIDSE